MSGHTYPSQEGLEDQTIGGIVSAYRGLSSEILVGQTIGYCIATILFFVVGTAVLTVFYQMDRNTILSLLSGTDPGTTSRNFIRPMISYGALPLLTLLVTQFPELRQFVLTFVEPLLRAAQ